LPARAAASFSDLDGSQHELAAAEDRKMESERGSWAMPLTFLRAMLADGEEAVKEIEPTGDKQGISRDFATSQGSVKGPGSPRRQK